MLIYDLTTKKIVEKPEPGHSTLSKQPRYAQRFPTQIVKFGYERGKDLYIRNTFIRRDKKILWLISYAFELIDQKGYSLRKTLEVVTAKGLRSKRDKPLALSTLFKILTDRFYTGLVWHEGEWLVATHEPAVSKERFERVQEYLIANRRSPGKKKIVCSLAPFSTKNEQKVDGFQN